MSENVDSGRLRTLLASEPWITSLSVLQRVDSTNEEVRRLAQGGARSGAVVVAEAQTAGRGRRGRRWVSAAGLGLYVSVLFRPAAPVAEPARWTLAGAVAAAKACRQSGASISIKWPNDLQWQGRKVGGVLAEMRSTGRRISDMVIGTGLNVFHREQDFPFELRGRAVSLAGATGGRAPAREALAARYLHELGLVAGALEAGDWDSVCRAWESLAPEARGHRVRVLPPGEGVRPYEGITGGLAADGGLRVTGDDGRTTTVRLAESLRSLEV